ncbi:hypothetical protein O6H91_23G052200 [Diphasiastrum complanatum]|uniref:Uncharacterized protein n=1 Tax=Diphasiastrum complanatum TaxID=34168 RepID=A0ACC2AAK7_DIPCM|nr:hypothetical protein O6H91_23G052200 [Diphasiastrum complanatum]
MGSSTMLHLPSGPTGVIAKLHPTVMFNICDSYIRRNDQQERVIGTLLGAVSTDGIVEIRNSYAVPHNESSDQVAVDIDYHRSMFELHQRVNPKEVIIGWLSVLWLIWLTRNRQVFDGSTSLAPIGFYMYSTSSGVSGSDALIQDFYAREVTNPVHLTIDTMFSDETTSIKAYVSTSLTLGERQLAAQFHEIQLDLRLLEAERIGFDLLKKTMVEKLPSDLEGLEQSIGRLQNMIEVVFRYTDDVVEGRILPDNTIGRYLLETISMVPKIAPEAFDRLFNDSIQDLLLVVYLANLTRTQLALAEKLNSAAQIL